MPSTGSSNPQLKKFEPEVRPLCSVILDETVHITLNNSHHTLFKCFERT